MLVSHPAYGKMIMAEETLCSNQWVNFHTGTRYGTFRTLRGGMYVTLPISEVTVLI